MINPEQIPEEVAHAAFLAFREWEQEHSLRWHRLIAAAINAWPGMGLVDVYEDISGMDVNNLPEPDYVRVELPLSKEQQA